MFLVVFCLPIFFWQTLLEAQNPPFVGARRVLFISIDGFHPVDLANFIQSHPSSALAQLSSTGVTYTEVSTPKPSNSFPGLLAMVTGAEPRSTGIWYEGAYARKLSPAGSNCKTIGTVVNWAGSIDKDKKQIDAGGGIDPAKLPLDPNKGCVPVYPHEFLRVNTIFEVAHFAGLRTAYIDKHPAYEMVNGPSGLGVDDLYAPELSAVSRRAFNTKDVKILQSFDDLKIEALLNEIAGKDHTGKNTVGVPAIFGASLQGFRFAQVISTGGYTDASGTMSAPLLDAIEHIDQSVGKMVSALKARGLLDSTLIIVTSKHGQSPMDRRKHRSIDEETFPKLVNQLQSGLVAFSYSDGNVTSIWLTDQSQTSKVAEMLNQPANQSSLNIEKVLWGESLKAITNDPLKDERIPDIVVLPNFGTMYVPADDDTIAAHNGFNAEDTQVALVVSNPGLKPRVVKTSVRLAQVAPTILQVLGLAPESLQGVVREGTEVLPGLFAGKQNLLRMLSPE